MSNPTAGSGEPFWYEWTVGLQRIVEMLRVDSEILSVTLQAHGIKGWDDVVVKRANDRREFIQVKHSRGESNLTFGSLVSVDKNGSSLLKELFLAFCKMGAKSPNDSCIIFTNREAGASHGRSEQDVLRPPLLKFTAWLKGEIKKRNSLNEIAVPTEWLGAWQEWISQLACSSDAEKFEFLKVLDVKTNQQDLRDLTESLLNQLAEIFGSQPSHVRTLLHALDHALRNWTSSGVPVTAETVMDALALEREIRGEHRAPPPPAPFFPSRQPFIEDLEKQLVGGSGPSVIFLSAEPGAGKTSVLSQLANRRTSNALQGVVGIRYFAFRPITPESPIIPADSDKFVNVDSLWFDLLRQLRRGLMGQLRAYRVPIRDELLDWQQARDHVLRLSSLLGKELGRPFVIAIDGIDHAARAAIYDPSKARDFFSSLPTPEELQSAGIRLLLAGQPAHNYPQYPQWLRVSSSEVKELSLSKLQDDDIELLLVVSASQFHRDQHAAAIRTIQEITEGNTLSVVFAAMEAATCENVAQLQDRLLERKLQSGITSYYRSIWEHCLAGEPQDIGPKLAGIICLARERLTGKILSSVFPQAGRDSEKWESLFRRLGPLLVEENDGFRVRHNDIRVFLQGCLSAVLDVEKRSIVGAFVDHYLNANCNRRIAHESLFLLLEMAGREDDSARLFSTSWVIESIALGFDYDHIATQCIAALSRVSAIRDWDVLVRVSCACETLERWRETQEYTSSDSARRAPRNVPAFLSTETFVRPMSEWDSEVLRRLADDAQELFDGGETDRASALLNRWVGNLNLSAICSALKDLEDGPRLSHEPRLAPGAENSLEALGEACRSARVNLNRESCNDGILADAALAFEKGWVTASCRCGPWDTLLSCFGDEQLQFFETIMQSASAFVGAKRWPLLGSLLEHYEGIASGLVEWQPLAAYIAAWWGLVCSKTHSAPAWLESIKERELKKDCSGDGGIYVAIYAAKIRGWQDPSRESGTIANEALEAMALTEYSGKDRPTFATWLRAAAIIGQIAGMLSRRGPEIAADMLRLQELRQVLESLWNPIPALRTLQDTSVAGKLAEELIDIVIKLGKQHLEVALKVADTAPTDWPVDSRRNSLWLLQRTAGNFPLLRAWIDRWLGEEGKIWSESSEDRDFLIKNWRPFANEIGETVILENAEARQAWSRLNYRTDRDDSFFAAAVLLDEFLKVQPEAWATTGIRLWSLCNAASALRGDINQAWGIPASLAKATLRLPPNAICQLMFLDIPNRDENWHDCMRDAVAAGLAQVACEKRFNVPTMLSLWCLANGFCRWFSNHDVGLLYRLKAAFADALSDSGEKSAFERRVSELTPGEAIRTPKKDEQTENDSDDSIDESTATALLDALSQGQVPSVLDCIRLINAVKRQKSDSDGIVQTLILNMVNRRDWPTSWRMEGDFSQLINLGAIISEDQIWAMIVAACSEANKGNYWLQAVTGNLHIILIAWAKRRGADVLQSFLEIHCEMHELWLQGGRKDLPYSEISPPNEEFADSWEKASAKILIFLLNSRSGEIVASALRGIHALVCHCPGIVPFLFEASSDDYWKARWILNGSEKWVFIDSQAVEASREWIEKWLNSSSLEHRLQSWLVLSVLAELKGDPKPELPWPKKALPSVSTIERQRDVLDLPPEKVGLMHISTRHRSAEQHMKILEVIFGELPKVRHYVAQQLDDLPSERRSEYSWPASMRQRNDTDIGLPDIGFIIGKVLTDAMAAPRLNVVPKLAQAFMPNEESWIVGASPVPDTKMTLWPDSEGFGDYQTPPNIGALRAKLLPFACEHNIAAGDHVLCATVELYTTYFDFHYHIWWERAVENEAASRTRKPSTISARAFCWRLEDWWEADYSEVGYPIAFVPGGFQWLSHSFVSWFPSKAWIDELGWKPDPSNPQIWYKDGIQVARFEQFHGELRDTRNYHARQSIISRWVASSEGWEQIKRIGEWRLLDDIEIEKSPEK